MRPPGDIWLTANQRHLTAEVARVRARVERHFGRDPASVADPGEPGEGGGNAGGAFALERVVDAFGLSAFERDILLLCAGVELSGALAALLAAAMPPHGLPTFGLALATLEAPHWSAMLPAAALRRHRLLELCAGDILTQTPLRIDERTLHFLCGVLDPTARIAGGWEVVSDGLRLAPSQRRLASDLMALWTSHARDPRPPRAELVGPDGADRRGVAAAACADAGLVLHRVRVADVPAAPAEREALAQMWGREVALVGGALLVDADRDDTPEGTRAALALAERVSGIVLTASRDPWPGRERASVRFAVARPGAAEQVALWREALGPKARLLDGELDGVVSRFSLSAAAIASAADRLRQHVRVHPSEAGSALLRACREEARPRLDELAERIAPRAGWGDLVLPAPLVRLLEQIAIHVFQRPKVYEQWGYAEKGERGAGVAVLFAGASGTGKTLAAEVLAGALALDLYRIDLSRVVSKYIGETEKNLRSVFDGAEEGSAVLLFDEADALFGKRSEVRDSHDRYANIEVSYLLQRMEAYRGLAVLTTNMRTALDPAFLRRLRFVIEFPFPDPPHRREIWRRSFPPRAPLEAIDVERLARLPLAGGNIRNVALNAAFLAADAGEPVRMVHLERAARDEYDKIERPFPETEWRAGA